MAINDVYTTYKCKACRSRVDEIACEDSWGTHIYSKYKCTNPECGMKSEDDDGDFDDKVETTYHDLREKNISYKESEHPLQTDISFEVSNETGNEAIIVAVYSGDYHNAKPYFEEIKSRCKLLQESIPGTWSISCNYNELEYPHALRSDYIIINATDAIYELKKIRINSDFNFNRYRSS